MAGRKKRLDDRLVEDGLCSGIREAQAVIMSGSVLVNDQPVDKAGTLVPENARIVIRGQKLPYVSRGGLKLEGAIRALDIDVNGQVCMDVGASTGGFTDCLLQHGAARVYAVDVGYGQLAWTLRQDRRVIVMERTNIRHMPEDALSETVDIVVIDASFISLKQVVPPVLKFMKPDAFFLALIKPQFEVGRDQVGAGGVVRDAALHDEVIRELQTFFTGLNLMCKAVVPSPVLGPRGNREFIIHMVRQAGKTTI